MLFFDFLENEKNIPRGNFPYFLIIVLSIRWKQFNTRRKRWRKCRMNGHFNGYDIVCDAAHPRTQRIMSKNMALFMIFGCLIPAIYNQSDASFHCIALKMFQTFCLIVSEFSSFFARSHHISRSSR